MSERDVTACCPFCGAEYFATNDRCRDCHLALDPPPPATLLEEQLDNELVYELADWPVHARVRLSATLAEKEIAYRWEPGPDLVVRDNHGDAVDALLDEVEMAEVEPPDGEVDEEDDDLEWDEADEEQAAAEEVAQAAMADMFVAADRLMHEPGDPSIAEDLVEAAGIVDDSAPPFGIEPQVWIKVRELAAAVRDDLQNEADDESVALDAQALREALRPYV